MKCRVHVDLQRVRANVLSIRQRVGVDVIAVVKCGAYGLDIVPVADAVADLVSGFQVFHPGEAIEARLWEIAGKPILATVPVQGDTPELLRSHRIRPGVWTAEQASFYASAEPVLCLDTGMQRFACPPQDAERVLGSAPIGEAFTHAVRAEQAKQLRSLLGGRGLRLHAAGSALMDDPDCRLDAVRPGLAMYDGSVRATVSLVDARDSRGPVGYTGFFTRRHGVILLGYQQCLRPGPCMVNGREQKIIEVGMQSSYVTLDPQDRAGDEVILMDTQITPARIAQAWQTSPQQALMRVAAMGERSYA